MEAAPQEDRATQDYSELDAPGAAFTLLHSSEGHGGGWVQETTALGSASELGQGIDQTERDSSESAMRLDSDVKPAAVQHLPTGLSERQRCARASGTAPDVLTRMRETREAEQQRTPHQDRKQALLHMQLQ